MLGDYDNILDIFVMVCEYLLKNVHDYIISLFSTNKHPPAKRVVFHIRA